MSQSLQDLVWSYFRLYPDLADIREFPGKGTAEITLSGDLASCFHNQGVAGAEGSGQRLIKLLLKSDNAAVATGFETLSPDSQLVRMIQNQLEQQDSLFCRTTALLSVSGTFQDLRQLGLQIRRVTPTARIDLRDRRYFIVSYLFSQTICERLEDTIRVVVEVDDKRIAHSDTGCRVLPPGRAKFLSEMSCVDIASYQGTDQSIRLPPLSGPAMERVLKISQEDAAARVSKVAPRRASETLRKLDEEKKQTQAFFEARAQSDASEFRRKQAEEEQKTRLAQLEEVFKVRAELELLSVQELLVPVIEYSLAVDPAGELQQRFAFDPLGNTLTTAACTRCGMGHDKLHWDYCDQGHHLECEDCRSILTCCEQDCSHTACPDHVRDCVVCEQFICHMHTAYCPSCGHGHCSKCHGPVERHDDDVCLNCRENCKDCSSDVFHHKQDIRFCSVCSGKLCQDHRDVCHLCDSLLCHTHTVETRNGSGCAECYAHCQTCLSKDARALAVARSGLAHCVACLPDDRGLHCAELEHAAACGVCSDGICGAHRIRLHDGRWSCPTCTRQCIDCHDWFEHKTMPACEECREPVCRSDMQSSQYRSETFCRKCAGLLFGVCPGCDRRGPRRELTACVQCGIRYCQHCRVNSQGRLCHFCEGMAPIQFSESEWSVWRESFSNAPRGTHSIKAWHEMELALDSQRDKHHWCHSESHRYRLLHGDYHGGWLGILTRWMRTTPKFLIVLDKQKHTAEVRIIP